MKAPGAKLAVLPGPEPCKVMVPPLVACSTPPRFNCPNCVAAIREPEPSALSPPPIVVDPVPVPVKVIRPPDSVAMAESILMVWKFEKARAEPVSACKVLPPDMTNVLPLASPVPVSWMEPPAVALSGLAAPKE